MRVIESEHSVSYVFNEFPVSSKYRLRNPLAFAKKRANYYMARFQRKRTAIQVLNYPFSLIIDPTSICTLHCPLCPTGQGNTSRPRGSLRYADFKKLIDEVGDFLVTVNFTNWGEPFLNKDIFSMIRYCKQKGIPYTSLDSNLNTFYSNDTETLVLSGLDRLTASIDGASQKTYEIYRKGGDFELAVSNLRFSFLPVYFYPYPPRLIRGW